MNDMPLRFYNTLTSTVEDFRPIQDMVVRMYVCGPTVYDYSHMGHARSYIMFDVIRRFLKYRGYNVIYVQNFTDVDDKILRKAAELDVTPLEVSRRYIAAYFEDFDRLNVMRADYYPRVSENMDSIIDMITGLVEKGHAYVSDGSVYFSIDSMKNDVGVLSHQSYDALKVGARIEPDERKRNPMDFVLWKASKPGECIYWESPWGKGRPGWHVECSAMSIKLLGDQIDIHGGGMDLIFPHHESEVLQSEAFTGKRPFAKYWIHNGFLLINKEKMSKSLGNFFLIRDVLKKYPPEVVRFFILNTNYQGPLDYSDAALDEAKRSHARIRNAVSEVESRLGQPAGQASGHDIALLADESLAKFDAAMDDNFSTREALAVVFDWTREINRLLGGSLSTDELKQIMALYKHFSEILGIAWIPVACADVLSDELLALIVDIRQAVRKKKDFETSDLIRSRLKDLGITIEDTKEGIKIKKS
ncbi:MAG: cysteine--tRNA ligase [Methanocella sp.]